MFKRSVLICLVCLGLLVLSCLLAGCGMRPQVDFYVNPVATGEGQEIDAKAGSITKEFDDFSITVSALDTVELLKVTSDPRVNPYVYVGGWRVVKPRYVVFDVVIKNKSESEFMIDLSDAMLMDEQGEQYETISYERLAERYGSYPRLEREIFYPPSPRYYYPPYNYGYRPWPRPWYYHYDRYWGYGPSYVREVYDITYIERAILRGTMFKGVKLYSGGKRQGFLVFPMVAADVKELKIIFPFIAGTERIEFRFERVPVTKE